MRKDAGAGCETGPVLRTIGCRHHFEAPDRQVAPPSELCFFRAAVLSWSSADNVRAMMQKVEHEP